VGNVEDMNTPFRIASFNVRRLSSRPGARSNDIGRFLGSLRLDAAALQELGHDHLCGGGALDEIAAVARIPHYTFSPHGSRPERGVGILHRSHPLERSGGKLPARLFADKGYTRVVLEPGALAGTCEVIGLHLDPFSRTVRSRQIEQLGRELGAPTGLRIVLGDLNAMTCGAWMEHQTHDDTVDQLAATLGVRPPGGPARKTFPGRHPRFALDWILVSAGLSCEVQVIPTALSDHAAIVAEIRRCEPAYFPRSCVSGAAS
jgi:endonuclease/exonuclease/phosphatase family metal-dependent hydrolase